MTAGLLFLLAATLVVSTVISSTSTTSGQSTIEGNTSVSSSDSSSSTYSYTHDLHPDYPDCDSQYALSLIGNGYCTTSLNTASCGWDGGDCCTCTCNSNSSYGCRYLYDNRDCKDPSAPISIGASSCQNVSFQVPQGPRCSQNHTKWVISTTANATSLAEATNCSDGYFEVEWRDHVGVNETIHVLNGTRVKINGTSNAVADGGGVVQIFLVYNGSLDINNMTITNGAGNKGGAISLFSDSELIADNVTLTSNTGQNVGGAISSTSSYLELMSTTFDRNTAPHGGAIFIHNSEVVGVDSNIFTNNNASQNGGALCIMGISRVGWNMRFMYNGTTVDSSFRYNYICGRSLYYHSDCYWDVIGDKSGETFFLNNSAGVSGGAMYVSTSDVSWSGEASIEQNSAYYGGALYLEGLATVKIQGATTFASNNALFNGGAIGATDGSVTFDGWTNFTNNTCGGNGGAIGATDGYVELNGSTNFTNNTCGGNGGAIGATDGYVEFNGSTIFTNNTCGVNGGAIELSTSDIETHGNVTFLQNSAGSFGGALYASRIDEGPTLDGITFSSNTADSGGAVFFSAVGTDLYPLSSSEYENIASYASTFNGCRFEGNSASSKGGAIYSALGSDYVSNTTFKGNSANTGGGISVSGIIYMSNLSFEDNTSSEGEGPAVFNGGVTAKMAGLYFSGNGYHCSSDTYRGFNETGAKDGRYNVVCDGCDVTCEGCTIEDDHSTPICLELLDHTQSNGGTATLETLIVDSGYWRATDTSINILPCFNEKACRGGVTGSPNYCSKGYEGPYCAVCSQGYVRTISYRCSKCSSKTSFGPAVFAVLGGLAVLMLLLFVYYMVRIERGGTTQHSIDSFKKVLAVQSLKIIIVSWQIVTQFSEVTNVVYPSLYQGLLDVVAAVNFDLSWILSAGCFDVDFYVGFIAATAGPLVIMALLGITLATALHRNRGEDVGRRIVRRKHVNAVILLAFIVYSSASSAVFKTFVCDSLDDGKTYLRADYRVTCTSPKHRAFQIYAGCMIAVYPLGIPVLFAILLFRNRKVLENVALRTYNGELVQQSTSSLWKPYKPSVFYYEVVECGRRLMLTGIMVFIYPNTAAQIAVTLAMAFMFALMSERLKPYESKWDGWVARIGHFMIVLTMFVALLTKVDVSDEGTQSQNVFAAILVAAHAAMVLTGVTEAVLLIRSVQENDAPIMRRPRNISALPVENFSSIHDRGES